MAAAMPLSPKRNSRRNNILNPTKRSNTSLIFIFNQFIASNKTPFMLFSKMNGEIVNAEEMAYEFCKPLIREKKIADLLDE